MSPATAKMLKLVAACVVCLALVAGVVLLVKRVL